MDDVTERWKDCFLQKCVLYVTTTTQMITASEITHSFHQMYPSATYELHWKTPVQLLVATILAAQCTDERVNKVTQTLFVKYPDAKAFAHATPEELELMIKSTGTYRQKAKAIIATCQAICEKYQGEVPKKMAELITLPGVARKTANVVLSCAFQIAEGIVVDTHVTRVSQRMGLSTHEKPEKIEQDLMKIFPKTDWTFVGPALVLHGRYTCKARSPHCQECIFQKKCPQIGVTEKKGGS